jgi:hypothetical protein
MQVKIPLAACQGSFDGASCQDVLKSLQNPYYIGDQPGLTQTLGWVDAWVTKPSVYAVAARNAGDIAAAVNFARANNLRLVVKGGGHSYQGTSNAPDSLLIWTRHMSDITMHAAFAPHGCGGAQKLEPAVTLGAGAIWIQAYDAVTTKGRSIRARGRMHEKRATAIGAARDTAMNPAVLDAFALAIIAAGEQARLSRIRGHEPNVAVAPGASYVSESNFFEPGWQQSFWGSNYERLQTVKAKYDPDGLFFVHHGVGSENWSADGFTLLLGSLVRRCGDLAHPSQPVWTYSEKSLWKENRRSRKDLIRVIFLTSSTR